MFRRILPYVVSLAGLTLAGPVRAEDPVQTVDALNKVSGVHQGFRANHAKGVVVEGSFKATPQAAELSRATLFSGKTIPVTVRFSDSTGLPDLPDGSNEANPHGMAIKYHLPDGSDTDMVINSLKFFPVATGQEFQDLLLAIADSPPQAPKPTKLDQFAAAHPALGPALASVQTPASFANEQYNGLDAFVFVDKAGKRQAVRYIMVPEQLLYLKPADAAKRAPDFLIDELPARLQREKVTFHLKAQLAEAGDQTKDPSKPWPADRKVVDLGVLTIDHAVPDSLEAQKKLLFVPGLLTDGIEASDDPLIDFAQWRLRRLVLPPQPLSMRSRPGAPGRDLSVAVSPVCYAAAYLCCCAPFGASACA